MNTNLFAPKTSVPVATARNEAGGSAYRLSAKASLAQYAMTGCLNQTYYASAETQLDTLIRLCDPLPPQFIAQTAIYARQRGYMKDTPAFLCALLAMLDTDLLSRTFPKVIDNGKMLRNFVQVIRSGVLGRKSFGSRPKALIQHWFESRSDLEVFKHSIGQSPSLADVIRMVHPKPNTESRRALYGYLLDKEVNLALLPEAVQLLEKWKKAPMYQLPELPFQLLTSLPLQHQDWCRLAQQVSWQTLRMNLNTFARHKVFDTPKMVAAVAARLRNVQSIREARVFPYQLLAAWKNLEGVPSEIQHALKDAMEIAIENIPELPGKTYILPDVSGSMSSPVTGHRAGATTKVRCVDVAGLMAAALQRRNLNSVILPFDTKTYSNNFTSKDVLSTASALARFGGGGTSCSVPLVWMNKMEVKANTVIYVSDNESWVDSRHFEATAVVQQWEIFKQRNPRAKLVCIDIQPYSTSQAPSRNDILNVGGFSDEVFTILGDFVEGNLHGEEQVRRIEAVAV